MTKPDGRRQRTHQLPRHPERGCIVEDVDGMTCVIRAARVLTETEREQVATFVTELLAWESPLDQLVLPPHVTITDDEHHA